MLQKKNDFPQIMLDKVLLRVCQAGLLQHILPLNPCSLILQPLNPLAHHPSLPLNCATVASPYPSFHARALPHLLAAVFSLLRWFVTESEDASGKIQLKNAVAFSFLFFFSPPSSSFLHNCFSLITFVAWRCVSCQSFGK